MSLTIPAPGSGSSSEPINVAQVGGTTVVTGGINGLLGVGGPSADGTAAASAGNPVVVAGQDGTNLQTLLTGILGELRIAPVGSTYTDRSSTIAAGGTAQQFAAANTARRGWRVQNLSSGNLFINDKGVTAVATQTGASFTLVPGAMYEGAVSGVSTAAISIIGATTAQAFEGAEW